MRRIRVKRVYEAADPNDGARVLVDRLWPRGIAKDRACLAAWKKEVAPSTPLRMWLHADPATRWDEFAKRYKAELAAHHEVLEQLRGLARDTRLTLVTSVADVEHSHIPVLLQILEGG